MTTERRLLSRPELEEAAASRSGMAPRVVVVLDDIRSRHNVGAVFRTADAFGMERLLLCGFTPLPPHREIEKTALGATETVPWTHFPDVGAAIRALRVEGFLILAVEQTSDATPLQFTGIPTSRPVAVVFGNEIHGVSAEALALSDGVIALDQAGAKHSLNVSVCAGIVLWWLSGRHLRNSISPETECT